MLLNNSVLFYGNAGVRFYMPRWLRSPDPKVTGWEANVQRCGRAFKNEVTQTKLRNTVKRDMFIKFFVDAEPIPKDN